MVLNNFVNTFPGGLDFDQDVSFVSNNSYRWAENIRLLTDNAGTSTAIQLMDYIRRYTNEGSWYIQFQPDTLEWECDETDEKTIAIVSMFTNGLDADEEILGVATTRWWNSDLNTYEECGIVITKLTVNGTDINNIWVITGQETLTLTFTLVLSACMGLTDRLSIVTNVETPEISKIYVTDGNSQMKIINIQNDYGTTKESPITDQYYFDSTPGAILAPFLFQGYCEGLMDAGNVLYAYQLFTNNNTESKISPLSHIIPIIPSEVHPKNNRFVRGGEVKNNADSTTDTGFEKCGVGCKLEASIMDYLSFSMIRVYRIFYPSSTDSPNIYVIDEVSIPDSGGTEVFTFLYEDHGLVAIDEITVELFTAINNYDFAAKCLAKKDNMLFAANLSEITWTDAEVTDDDYDARAYSCNLKGIVKLNSSLTSESLEVSLNDILSGAIEIPANHDCINPINESLLYPDAADLNTDDIYAYGYEDPTSTPDGRTIRGGRGLNIAYKFVIADMLESDLPPASWDGSTSNGYVYPAYSNFSFKDVTTNSSLTQLYVPDVSLVSKPDDKYITKVYRPEGDYVLNHASPEMCAYFRGYQRDEIYRFGIIFYNRKTEPSAVHWIADIRIPPADDTISDSNSYRPYTTGNTSHGQYPLNELISHPIGILFEVNNVPEGTVAYEIVRCKRNFEDRTVVTQGICNRTLMYSFFNEKNEFDLDVCMGIEERRPLMVPEFSNTMYTKSKGTSKWTSLGFAKRTNFTNGSYQGNNKYYTAGSPSQNPIDTDGIFDFTSADICFNRYNREEIVSKGMYLVPIYCVTSGVILNDAKLIRNGVPWTTYRSPDHYDRRASNSFGLVVKDGDDSLFCDGHYDSSSNTSNQDSGKYPSLTGGCMKYYTFFDARFAKEDMFDNSRTYYTIDKAIAPLILSQFDPAYDEDDGWAGALKIIKDYFDIIDVNAYVNCSIGSQYRIYAAHGINMALYVPSLYDDYLGISTTPFLSSPLNDVLATSATLVANIKRLTTLYGGRSYSARNLNSVYYSTGTYVNLLMDFTSKNDYRYLTAACFGGDVFLGIFDYAVSLPVIRRYETHKYLEDTRYVSAYLALESSVNPYFRTDKHYQLGIKTYDELDEDDILDARCQWDTEYAETYFMHDVGQLGVMGVLEMPMYTYNSSYSVTTPMVSPFVEKNQYASSNNYNAFRIAASEIKTPGEGTDNWSKFLFANYVDVDSDYGEITNLLNFKDLLYFFLHSSVGIASVNDRSLISDNDGAALTLGTGDVLGRYDYVVVTNGDSVINDTGIVTSESTVYWYDYDKNLLCSLGNNGFEELSKVKFVLNYMHTNKDNIPLVASGYDKKYNEVWFKLVDTCLIFNELLAVFSSFYIHNPQWFMQFSTRLVTICDKTFYYIHNLPNVNPALELREDRTCKIEFIVNENEMATKTFDNLYFSADLYDPNNSWKPAVITNVVFHTKMLESEQLDYRQIEDREDTYRFYIPREVLADPEEQERVNMSYASRMKGKYLICDYTFDANNDKEFKIPHFGTTYRQSYV